MQRKKVRRTAKSRSAIMQRSQTVMRSRAKTSRKKFGHFLCLEKDDPELELEFEVYWQMRLTRAQHFQRMWDRSLLIAQTMIKHGHHTDTAIFQRA